MIVKNSLLEQKKNHMPPIRFIFVYSRESKFILDVSANKYSRVLEASD